MRTTPQEGVFLAAGADEDYAEEEGGDADAADEGEVVDVVAESADLVEGDGADEGAGRDEAGEDGEADARGEKAGRDEIDQAKEPGGREVGMNAADGEIEGGGHQRAERGKDDGAGEGRGQVRRVVEEAAGGKDEG